MINSLANDMALIIDGQWLPFIFIILGIAITIVSQILHSSLRIAFTAASACVMVAWVSCFFIDVDGFDRSSIIIFDKISDMGIKLILPSVFAIIWMVFIKPGDHERKTSALLLLLISSFGAMVTLASHDWMMFFIGIQCTSLPLYGLLVFNTDDKMAVFASARYFVLSLIAMAFLLFGILLLYAATGSMDIYQQVNRLNEVPSLGLFFLGFSLVLVGIAFKASIFPFHIWAPDVYQKAPLFVVSYLIVVVKAAVLLFFMRSFFLLYSSDWVKVTTLISSMAILSMWIGNALMLFERSVMRMLAYLSIAHLGYLMIPILARSALGIEAIFLDIAAFGVAVLVMLFVVKSVMGHSLTLTIDEFSGLVRERPLAGFALITALISLLGFPLTAGFVGKYAIFSAGVNGQLWQMTLHMMVSSIFGLLALAKIIVACFAKEPPKGASTFAAPSWSKNAILVSGALIILSAGLFPSSWVFWAKKQSSEVLLMSETMKLSAQPSAIRTAHQ